MDLYDNDKQYLESRVLRPGNIILLADGGHGFDFMDESEIIET